MLLNNQQIIEEIKKEIKICMEKTLKSTLDCKKIQPVHPKGDQSWMFIGRTGAEAEIPILSSPHAVIHGVAKSPT